MFATGKIQDGVTVIKARRSMVSEKDLAVLQRGGNNIMIDYTSDLVVITRFR